MSTDQNWWTSKVGNVMRADTAKLVCQRAIGDCRRDRGRQWLKLDEIAERCAQQQAAFTGL